MYSGTVQCLSRHSSGGHPSSFGEDMLKGLQVERKHDPQNHKERTVFVFGSPNEFFMDDSYII